MMEKKRIEWIDILRGLGMFIVIWGHCFLSDAYRVKSYIYSFHMPLFFFISGLTFSTNYLDLPFKDYIKRKIKGLLVPYLIINLIGILILFIYSKFDIVSFKGIVEYLCGMVYSSDSVFSIPSSNTWFIPCLFLVDILFYLICKYSKGKVDILYLVCLCGIVSYANGISGYQVFGPWHIETALTGIVFYYLGYVFISNQDKFEKLYKNNKIMFIVGLILAIVGILFAASNRRITMNGNKYGAIISFYISSFSTIFGLVLFVKLFLKKSYVFRQIGKDSIFYLGYHFMFVRIVKSFFPELIITNLGVICVSICITCILFILSFIMKKYLPIVFGKSKTINLLIDKVFDKI